MIKLNYCGFVSRDKVIFDINGYDFEIKTDDIIKYEVIRAVFFAIKNQKEKFNFPFIGDHSNTAEEFKRIMFEQFGITLEYEIVIIMTSNMVKVTCVKNAIIRHISIQN